MIAPLQRLAMQGYRTAWLHYCETYDDCERKKLEKEMDKYQEMIADGPRDPVWQKFIHTLPGYVEYWESAWERALADLREMQ